MGRMLPLILLISSTFRVRLHTRPTFKAAQRSPSWNQCGVPGSSPSGSYICEHSWVSTSSFHIPLVQPNGRMDPPCRVSAVNTLGHLMSAESFVKCVQPLSDVWDKHSGQPSGQPSGVPKIVQSTSFLVAFKFNSWSRKPHQIKSTNIRRHDIFDLNTVSPELEPEPGGCNLNVRNPT